MSMLCFGLSIFVSASSDSTRYNPFVSSIGDSGLVIVDLAERSRMDVIDGDSLIPGMPES